MRAARGHGNGRRKHARGKYRLELAVTGRKMMRSTAEARRRETYHETKDHDAVTAASPYIPLAHRLSSTTRTICRRPGYYALSPLHLGMSICTPCVVVVRRNAEPRHGISQTSRWEADVGGRRGEGDIVRITPGVVVFPEYGGPVQVRASYSCSDACLSG